MLPTHSVDLPIEEMRSACEVLGTCSGFLRPNPYHRNKMVSDPVTRFWTMASELDFSIGFHEGSTNTMPTLGVDRFDKGPHGAPHDLAQHGDNAGSDDRDLGRRLRSSPAFPHRTSGVGPLSP
jgi:hypothetical protein